MRDLLEIRYEDNGASARVAGQRASLEAGFGEVLHHLANIHVEELQKRTPVSHSGAPGADPGALKRGWYARRDGTGTHTRWLIGNKLRRVRYLLRGRAAIDQRKKSGAGRHPLHFWIDGQEFYRWSVRASAPNDFVPVAVSAARARQVPEFHSRLQETILVRRIF